jgi:hypothetical protein
MIDRTAPNTYSLVGSLYLPFRAEISAAASNLIAAIQG